MNNNNQLCIVSMEDLRCILNECISAFKDKESSTKSEEKKLYSTNEVLKIFNISKPTLWRWNKSKYLCPIKIGERDNYYRSEDIKRIQGE